LDRKGQAFTIDAMFALILLTVIIGISADAMDIAGNKIHDYTTENSLDRIANDAADILIYTPGSPDNWEEIKYSTHITPGLAKYENGKKRVVSNTLSMRKMSRLKQEPEMLTQMLPESTSYNLIIYPTEQSLPIFVVQNQTPPNNIGDIKVVNRTILYDYELMDIYLSIKPDIYNENNESGYLCTHINMGNDDHKRPDFKISKSGWLCVPFTINMEDINSKDFYLLTDPNVLNENYNYNPKWIIDTPDNKILDAQKFTSKPANINSIISDLSRNKSKGTFVLHIFTSGDKEKHFNTYLVGVPKGTPHEDVKLTNLKPQPAFFVLKIWM
jgi:hypothetical protein